MMIADEDLEKLSLKTKKEIVQEVLKRPPLGVVFNASKDKLNVN